MSGIITNHLRKMNRQMYQSIIPNYLSKNVIKRNYSKKSQIFDKAYFENVLKGFYKRDNIQVDECKGGDKSSIQPSFMCEVKKFQVDGFKENKKFRLDLVVKQLHSKEHQELYKSHIAAKNEAVVYNTIFPYLNVYHDATLPVPICFFANNERIIVQDLCGINYKPFDMKKGFLTQKECIYVLEALARFHAATIVLQHRNSVDLKKIKNLTRDVLYNDKESPLLKHQHDCLQNILTIYKNRKSTEENATKIEALENLIKVAKNDIKNLLCEERDNYAFCHGDLVLTNFLYKPNDVNTKEDTDTEEIDVKFIDFQKVRYCSVASDLVYLLFINLNPEDYINNKEEILSRYFLYLIKNIEDCGVTVDPKLTYKWLLNEIDRFTEYGIIYALWVLPMFSDDNNKENREEVTKEVLDENSKKIFFNERMEKWVDYYSKIFKEKSK